MKAKASKTKCFLDSGCSKHMTGDKRNFLSPTPKQGGNVTFGVNAKGKIIDIGIVGKESTFIDDVLLVEGLKHNLLSISQLCDKRNEVIFKSDCCIVKNICDNHILLVAYRTNNVYTLEFDDLSQQNVKCLSALNEVSWLWHRRLGHANMELIHMLSKRELVKGLPRTKFVKDKICDACQLGKQHKYSFKSKKDITSSRPLDLLHLDLFGPNSVASLGGKL